MDRLMEFKKLLGNRVYIILPKETPKSDLQLDAETAKAVRAEELRKYTRLTVYAVGSAVEGLSEGDEVLIDPLSQSAMRPVIIPLSEKKDVLMVSYHDIAHIW